MDSFADQRRRKRLLRSLSEIADEAVLGAIATMPRHCFCLEGSAADAYVDRALAIGFGQTISQPSLVARMLEALSLRPGMRVLDIGSGSGYVTALISRILQGQGEIIALERIAGLQERARRVCEQVLSPEEWGAIQWRLADASLGQADLGPYDVIHVACQFPSLPDDLLAQLKTGGRLIIPVGDDQKQDLVLVHKTDSGYEQSVLTQVLFVPLRSGLEPLKD